MPVENQNTWIQKRNTGRYNLFNLFNLFIYFFFESSTVVCRTPLPASIKPLNLYNTVYDAARLSPGFCPKMAGSASQGLA